MERFGLEEGQELEHPWLNKSVETAQKRVEQRNYLDPQTHARFRRRDEQAARGRLHLSQRHDRFRGAAQADLRSHRRGRSGKSEGVSRMAEESRITPALLHWVNTTFPLGLTKEKAQFETRAVDENTQFLIEKIKDAYERKSSHEEPTAVKSLERYIILNAIDRLWQEHLYAMDALREGVYLRELRAKGSADRIQDRGLRHVRRADGEH